MKPDQQVKVAELLTASGQEIQKLAAENAQLRKENQEYRCEKVAREMVEFMDQHRLLPDNSPEAKLAEEQKLTKLAMEDPQGFHVRREAVKMAAAGSQGWGLGSSSENGTGSTAPGKTSFDLWVQGGLQIRKIALGLPRFSCSPQTTSLRRHHGRQENRELRPPL